MGLRVSATAASRCSDDGWSVEMAKPDMGRWGKGRSRTVPVPGALGTFSREYRGSGDARVYFLVRHYGF